jgi:hypothetical protein
LGALYKSNKKAGELSEKVFSILGFKSVDEQDFYNDFIIKDGVHVSVMEYRKNLKTQTLIQKIILIKKERLKL